MPRASAKTIFFIFIFIFMIVYTLKVFSHLVCCYGWHPVVSQSTVLIESTPSIGRPE
jgi:hypothetical protein